MHITPAALTALCGNKTLCFAHICHNCLAVCFTDDCATRHFNFKVLSLFAVASSAFSALTVRSGIFALVSKIGKGSQIVINNKNHVAAFSAVATVGPACGNIFFSVKGNGSCSTVTAFYFYLCYIYKHTFHHFNRGLS